VQYQQVEQNVEELGSLTTAALKLNANAAIGWSYRNYSLGGKILVDTLLSDIRGTQVYSTLFNAILYVGGRF
jgi:hypothetical protein